jgi:hypothetical protein
MKTPGMLLAAAIAATVVVAAFAADAPPPPKAEDIAKDYAKLLTRVTEKPKMVGKDFSYSCSEDGIPEYRAKFGPHLSRWVHYYRNDLAKGTGAMPVGSVIVKEKKYRERFDPIEPFIPDEKDLKTHAVAGMIKRPTGAFPKSGDWEFFWFEGCKLKTTGLESCAGCHSGAARDYVFTRPNGESLVKVAEPGDPFEPQTLNLEKAPEK